MSEFEKNQHEMSSEETVIGAIFKRVVTDNDYKQLLLSDPDKALEEYEISETQALLIKSLSVEDLEKLSPDNLDEFLLRTQPCIRMNLI